MGKTYRRDNQFRPKKNGKTFVKDDSWKKNRKGKRNPNHGNSTDQDDGQSYIDPDV